MEVDAERLVVFGDKICAWTRKYWCDLRDDKTDVAPTEPPGSLSKILPNEPPVEGDCFEDVMRDVDAHIMPRILHWMSPHFHGYFPSGNSAASLAGDLVSGAINAIGFSLISNPAGTELEVHVLDWLAKMLDLPDVFHFASQKGGGGVIMSSASESTFQALLASRERFIALYPAENPFMVMSKLVGYTSIEAHSSVARAGLLARCKIRLVPLLRKTHAMDTNRLKEMIIQDEADGLIPAFVCATLGTTGICAFDNLHDIGQICSAKKLWLHVDGAYGGNAMICPEYRSLMQGIEFVDSFVISPHKWMMVNYDCSVMWVKSVQEYTFPFIVEPEYLRYSHASENPLPDFRHWHTSCGRRFRALKLWFVIRMYGVSGLQEQIRKQVQLGEEFAELVSKATDMQILSSHMGVVGFRLKGPDYLTALLLIEINKTGKVRMVHTKIGDRFIIRFVASGARSTVDDIKYAWSIVRSAAERVSRAFSQDAPSRRRSESSWSHEGEKCRVHNRGRSGSLWVPASPYLDNDD